MSHLETQRVYVSLDLRRSLWVAEATGALIVCAYSSDLIHQFRKKGIEVWCFEEEYPEAVVPRSTFLLLSRALTLNMLQDRKKTLEFIVFKPSNKIKRWAEKQGWKLLSADVSTCRELEDKVTFAELAVKWEVPIPSYETVLWSSSDVPDYLQKYGDPFIVQGRMGHAGNCTFQCSSDSQPEILEGARVKISKKIVGHTYTLNMVVGESGSIVVGPVWRQLMDVPEWNSFAFGTIGVGPATDLNDQHLLTLKEALLSLKPLLKESGFKGFLGVDCMLDQEGKWWIIECNPRLTASISLECFIDSAQPETALLALHAEPELIKSDRFDFLNTSAGFGQIILRNPQPRNWKTPKTLKSGTYSIEDGQWQLVSREVDAQHLKTDQLVLLLSRPPGTAIEPGSDYATILFAGDAYHQEQLKDLFMDFYERVVLGRVIRSQDFWKDRFAFVKTADHSPIFLLRKAIQDPRDTGKELLKKLIQAEVETDECIQLLGEHNDCWLVKKHDESIGWLPKSVSIDQNASHKDLIKGESLRLSAQEFWEKWQGTPYQLGGVSIAGIDCSAFVQKFYWDVLQMALPKYSQDQRAAAKLVIQKEELQNNDLVFMHSKEQNYDHVGVFRDDLIWHSSLESGVVQQSIADIQKKYSIEECKRFC